MKDNPIMATLGQYNPANMTAQEVFDAACEHLLSQAQRSRDSDGTCVYKGPNDLCCGTAPFIVNYLPAMEFKTYEELVRSFGQPADHMELIREIQLVHDGPEPCNWQTELKELGERYNLTLGPKLSPA